MDEKKLWSDADIEEFKKICRPVVEFLQKRYCTPHHYVIIDWDGAVLVETICGISFKRPD